MYNDGQNTIVCKRCRGLNTQYLSDLLRRNTPEPTVLRHQSVVTGRSVCQPPSFWISANPHCWTLSPNCPQSLLTTKLTIKNLLTIIFHPPACFISIGGFPNSVKWPWIIPCCMNPSYRVWSHRNTLHSPRCCHHWRCGQQVTPPAKTPSHTASALVRRAAAVPSVDGSRSTSSGQCDDGWVHTRTIQRRTETDPRHTVEESRKMGWSRLVIKHK